MDSGRIGNDDMSEIFDDVLLGQDDGGAHGSVWPQFLIDAAKSSMERHGIKLSEAPIPGMNMFSLGMDVEIPQAVDGGVHVRNDDGTVPVYKLRANTYYVASSWQEGEPLTVWFLDLRDLFDEFEQTVPGRTSEVVDSSDGMETRVTTEPVEIVLKFKNIRLGERERPLSFDELLVWITVHDAVEDGNVELANKIVEAAYSVRPADAAKTAVSIKTSAIKLVDFATDKTHRKVWDMWATLPPGQVAFGFDESGSGQVGLDLANEADQKRGLQRVMTFFIDFDQLEAAGIAPRLEPYDRRVYDALSSLWNHYTTVTGQEVFSIKDVFYAMGHTTNPSARDKKKINDSITKMSRAHIAVDNIGETSAGYHYPHFVYEGSLLPLERITGYVDGQITDGLIHLFREPPLFTFARERKQFTSHSVRVLQSPLSKTSKNILIEDYLREQISWMKNMRGRSRSRKILFDSVFDEAGVTRRDDRLRKRKDVVRLLNHYVSCGWINGFTESADGFVIEL